MKLFEKIDTEKLEQAWANRFNPEVSFYGGKEVAFSPAVQAQVSPYGQVSTGEMPNYGSLHGVLIPNEFTGWMDECNAIATTCYIGDWSWLNKIRISGPDVIPCLEASTINGYKKFPIGKGRHIISVTPEGKMIGDGIAFREAEDTFLLTAGLTLAEGQMLKSQGFDVTVEELTARMYNFHVQGPLSGKVIEKLCGEDISDLGFLYFREIKIDGRDVRLYRGGMSGELGYELFGDSADGSFIWSRVVEAGREFGIRQYGYRSLMVNHLQAFFPTIWVDFLPANLPEEAHAELFYRSPVDFGWGGLMDKSRDFPGKAALVAEMEHPTHKTVMLEWDNEDCISIYTSLFDKENEPYEQMSLPVSVSEVACGAPAFVPVFSKDHALVGFASNRGYSYQFRKVISITYMDIAYATEGTEVFVLYGNEGKRQKMIRATVTMAPYKRDGRK